LFNKALREGLYEDKGPGKIYACSAYSYEERIQFDGAFKAGRFVGAFGYLIHTLVLLVVLSVEFVVVWKREHLWRAARILVVVSLICHILLFTVFGTELCSSDDSEDKCVPYAAGIIGIWNVLLMGGLVVAAWLTPVPEQPMFFVTMAPREVIQI
jgi:hypothetical protein